jgi:hypothetical protein
MENENDINEANNIYIFFFIGIIIVVVIYCIYKYDIMNIFGNTIEYAKMNTSFYLEKKIKEQFIQNGILKTVYFPENSFSRKVLETLGFL